MQRKTFALLLSYARPYRWRATIALINCAVTVTIGAFVGPYIIAQLLGEIEAGTISLAGSLLPISLYALTQIYGEVVGWRINLYLLWTFETAAQRDLYRDIFHKLSTESLHFHANRFGGSLVSQSTKLVGSFERFWDTLVFQFVPVITSITAATIILWTVFWQYALFLLILSLTFAVIVLVGSRFMLARNRAEAQTNTAMNGRLADMVTNVVTVKSHGSEQAELTAAGEFATTWRNASLHTMRGFLGISSIYSSLITVVQVAALVAAVIASEHRIISLSVAFLAISYTFTVARQLWEMNNIMRQYNRIMGDATDMVEILTTPTQIVDRSADALQPHDGAIRFRQVTFTHDGADKDALFHNFSLDIPAGQRVGLVGHSGSGKSSLVRILLRFSDIEHGTIEIDGQNIAHVSQSSLRRNIAYVPQEPLLFHRSLYENIAYGRPTASEAEVREAAKRAHALEFIEKLPEGFSTLVGERGVKLSGGQRQRIAIARAILKDAPILVLDEATSALDSESEKLIQASLDELMKHRTSIVIAHRLSTIQKMDRIVVLDNGRIIEDGNHHELLTRGGTYASLWRHQSGGFIEE